VFGGGPERFSMVAFTCLDSCHAAVEFYLFEIRSHDALSGAFCWE